MEVNSENLWNEFSKELQRFIISKVKDTDTSKDILQDAFIKMHLNMHTLNDPSRSKQWAYQVTRNTINDHFRKQKTNIDINSVDIQEEIPAISYTSQFAKCLNSFIKHLPQKYEEAITLVELQNINQLDLAQKLKISYSAAKSRVQRARGLLKEKFQACCNVSTDKYGNVISFIDKSTCNVCKI